MRGVSFPTSLDLSTLIPGIPHISSTPRVVISTNELPEHKIDYLLVVSGFVQMYFPHSLSFLSLFSISLSRIS